MKETINIKKEALTKKSDAKEKTSSKFTPKQGNAIKQRPDLKTSDELIDLLESDYNNENYYNEYLSKGKQNNSRKSNNKKLSSKSTNTTVNKIKSNFQTLVRCNELFKNTRSLTSSKGILFLNKLQNDIFSSYRDLNSLAVLVDSDLELKSDLQEVFKSEDILEQCSMYAYNLYSYVKMFQYKTLYLPGNSKAKFSGSSNNNDTNGNKTFKFKSSDLDSLKQIRSDEIHRLDSKLGMSLSQNQANNLSKLKEEKIMMEGEKSRLRINRLCNSRLKDLNNSIVLSQLLLNNVILSSSADLSSFALSSSDLAVASSKLLSKVDDNK